MTKLVRSSASAEPSRNTNASCLDVDRVAEFVAIGGVVGHRWRHRAVGEEQQHPVLAVQLAEAELRVRGRHRVGVGEEQAAVWRDPVVPILAGALDVIVRALGTEGGRDAVVDKIGSIATAQAGGAVFPMR